MQPQAPLSHLPLLHPRLVPLLISDSHLHAHPWEATLATIRSLEERRRTGVRILIYICGTLHSSTTLRHFSP